MSYRVKLNKDGIAEHVETVPGSEPSGEVVEIKSGEGVRGAGLPRRHTPQTMTKTGAIRIANMVARYWRERGATTVKLRVQRDYSIQETELWTVRSNLVAGLPPRS
jgi:hypothetical protein